MPPTGTRILRGVPPSAASADVLVVGAGVVGASIAYEVARRGASVRVVDAGAGPGAGCSFANAGLLSPSHVEPLTTPANVAAGLRYLPDPRSPFHIRPEPRLVPWLARFAAASTPRRARRLTRLLRSMAVRSVALHTEYGDALGTGLRQAGSLDAYLTHRRWSRVTAPATADDSLLDRAEAVRAEPALGRVAGAVRHRSDAHLDTLAFVQAVLRAARDQGVRVCWGEEVRRFHGHGDKVTAVETSGGTVTVGEVVLAAGLGTDALAAKLGLHLPLRGAKGYVVDLQVSGDVPVEPVTFKELRVVATPYADRLRLSGTLELGTDAMPPSPLRRQAVVDAGRRGLPRMHVERETLAWSGLRPCTADGVPAIGRTHRRRNVSIAAGHGMWGLVLGPVTGETVARTLLDPTPPEIDPALSPDRFTRR